MKIRDEIDESDEVVAQLAVTFTLLALAPYDSWGHEGTPAQMAAYIVKQSKARGNFGMLTRAILGERYRRG